MRPRPPGQDQKKPLRKADGSPEFRSVDEMLAHASANEEFADLPGKGKPLNLGDYFASGPEHRVASKILKDNAVLPQPLQDRRDAEELRAQAGQELARQAAHLAELKERIVVQAPTLTRHFADRQTLMALLDLAAWPDYLPDPAGEPLPARRAFLAGPVQLAELVASYNRRVEVAIAQHLDPLRRANECVDRLNKEVSFSRHLPAQLQLKPTDLDQATAEARAALPALPSLPDDLKSRLERYYKEQCPSFWQRLSS